MITVFVFDTDGKAPKVPKTPKVNPVENNPLVRFFYPNKDFDGNTLREVRLIGANSKYFVGLDVNDKNRYKKFLKDKISYLALLEFNPLSIK